MVCSAYKFETEVQEGGKVELTVPVARGVRVEVLVIAPDAEGFDDLVQASESSTEFWNNPEDDAAWNNA